MGGEKTWMGIAGICLIISGESVVYLRLRGDTNPVASYSDSELEDVAFTLETSMGGFKHCVQG